MGISDQEAEALFAEAERIASDAGNVRAQTIPLSTYGTILFTTRGRYRQALTPIRRAVSLAEDSGDSALYMMASGSAYVFFLLGEYCEGLAICDRAIEFADGDPTIGAGIVNDCPLAQCLMQRGGILSDLGRLDEARELIDRGVRMAAEQGATETVGWGHMWSVQHAYLCGDPERATIDAQKAVEIAERISDAFSRTWSWSFMGRAAVMGGEWGQALHAIQRAQAISSERRTAADAEGWCLVCLAEAYLGLGDNDRAADLARDGVNLVRGREQTAAEIAANVVLARVLLAVHDPGAHDEIHAALTRARELVDNTGAHGHEPTIHTELAELAHQHGDEAGRERELREAHHLFTQIGATGRAERLASQLATLADRPRPPSPRL